ncbi:hypothetical protein AVEN_2128-1 [Araneus ventricosus]|uniref:Uncharacterized protein n=1 Tax=Araneus ventricosus TaxID=182803 RepID=A0A4Y2EBT5_ARAVE|nr:hypothetical protein AVEN_2128-1 [Araneus ventricosus]
METQSHWNPNFAVCLRQFSSGFNIDEGVWPPVVQKMDLTTRECPALDFSTSLDIQELHWNYRAISCFPEYPRIKRHSPLSCLMDCFQSSLTGRFS